MGHDLDYNAATNLFFSDEERSAGIFPVKRVEPVSDNRATVRVQRATKQEHLRIAKPREIAAENGDCARLRKAGTL